MLLTGLYNLYIDGSSTEEPASNLNESMLYFVLKVFKRSVNHFLSRKHASILGRDYPDSSKGYHMVDCHEVNMV